jgi:hypothetical protein
MNRRETWYLWIFLAIAVAALYFMEINPSSKLTTNGNQTPTLGPVWTLAANTVASVRFEDVKTGQFVEMQNNAGQWVLASYILITPSATLPNTLTPLPTLEANVTPTATVMPSATNTIAPTPTLVASLTSTNTSIPPTKPADMSVWSSMLIQVQQLEPVQNLGDNLQPKDFGLTSPSYRLTIKSTDGKTSLLMIGVATPIQGGGFYAQMPGSKTIYLVSADLVNTLIGYLSTPPIVMTPTNTATNTSLPSATALPVPTQTPTLAATETPAESVTKT